MLRWNKAQQGVISSIIKMRHREGKLFREKVPLCDRLGHKLILEHRLTKSLFTYRPHILVFIVITSPWVYFPAAFPRNVIVLFKLDVHMNVCLAFKNIALFIFDCGQNS